MDDKDYIGTAWGIDSDYFRSACVAIVTEIRRTYSSVEFDLRYIKHPLRQTPWVDTIRVQTSAAFDVIMKGGNFQQLPLPSAAVPKTLSTPILASTPISSSVQGVCECGAKSTGVKPYQIGHYSFCPVRAQ